MSDQYEIEHSPYGIKVFNGEEEVGKATPSKKGWDLYHHGTAGCSISHRKTRQEAHDWLKNKFPGAAGENPYQEDNEE